ncbi:MAG TPA: hypothetical protein VKE51_21140 [Vicinamibacterales bacterium]|nr:hypothetical protein [Vicinamibacterales bacterium]
MPGSGSTDEAPALWLRVDIHTAEVEHRRISLLSCLKRGRFAFTLTLPQIRLTAALHLMTTLEFGAIIAACVIVAATVVVRLLMGRSKTTVDLSNVTVSRQWLIEHQSNDVI